MARISRAERTSLWLDRLHRHHQSGQSVAEFCLAEGVSQAALYQWKRRLSPSMADSQPTGRRQKAPQRDRTAKTKIDKDRSGQDRFGQASSGQARFTQLTVTNTQSTAARIRLHRDVVIELGTDRATIATVLAEVLDRCLPTDKTEQGGSSC